MIYKCDLCNKEYKSCPSWYARNKHHYCSPDCFLLASVDFRTKNLIKVGAKTRFKAGDKPSKNRKLPKFDEHHAWKGESVGYRGLHYWLRREKGVPESCVKCGKTGRIQWANISGEYHRDTSDYIAMCSSCHKKYDLSRLR